MTRWFIISIIFLRLDLQLIVRSRSRPWSMAWRMYSPRHDPWMHTLPQRRWKELRYVPTSNTLKKRCSGHRRGSALFHLSIDPRVLESPTASNQVDGIARKEDEICSTYNMLSLQSDSSASSVKKGITLSKTKVEASRRLSLYRDLNHWMIMLLDLNGNASALSLWFAAFLAHAELPLVWKVGPSLYHAW